MKEVNKQSSPTGISRREFLGMAATGAAALTILPSFTVAGLGHVAPSDKLYIAKIGCGGMGAPPRGGPPQQSQTASRQHPAVVPFRTAESPVFLHRQLWPVADTKA